LGGGAVAGEAVLGEDLRGGVLRGERGGGGEDEEVGAHGACLSFGDRSGFGEII
jgi:hypothetical protein